MPSAHLFLPTHSLDPKTCLLLTGIFRGGRSETVFPGVLPGVKSAGGMGGGAGMGVLACFLREEGGGEGEASSEELLGEGSRPVGNH